MPLRRNWRSLVEYPSSDVKTLLTLSPGHPKIQNIISEDAVSTDDDDLRRYGYSESSSYNIERMPVPVVYPKSTAEEASRVARMCHKYRIPMIPFSGGSVC